MDKAQILFQWPLPPCILSLFLQALPAPLPVSSKNKTQKKGMVFYDFFTAPAQ